MNHSVSPGFWNITDMEECCLVTIPAKVSGEDVLFKHYPNVLASFFTFLGLTGRLKNAEQMSQRVLAIKDRINEAALNPDNWGMGKSFAMAARKAGVDLTNAAEMQAFVVHYNNNVMASKLASKNPLMLNTQSTIPTTRVRSKVGRNDPCPCGSSKKYKRCCGK